MKDSDLLFPSETGDFRACSCLDRPFDEVVTALGLKKRIHAAGDEANVPGSGSSDRSEGRRDAGSVGARDRRDAAALLDGSRLTVAIFAYQLRIAALGGEQRDPSPRPDADPAALAAVDRALAEATAALGKPGARRRLFRALDRARLGPREAALWTAFLRAVARR